MLIIKWGIVFFFFMCVCVKYTDQCHLLFFLQINAWHQSWLKVTVKCTLWCPRQCHMKNRPMRNICICRPCANTVINLKIFHNIFKNQDMQWTYAESVAFWRCMQIIKPLCVVYPLELGLLGSIANLPFPLIKRCVWSNSL